MPPADPEPPEPSADAEDDLGVLCPNCAFANEPDVDFCGRCRAPLSMLATIDPLKQTFAEGFAYRSAVDGTSKPIVLIGIWLIFLPTPLLAWLRMLGNANRTLADVGWLAVISTVSVVILYRTTAGFVRKRREQRAAAAGDRTSDGNL